MNRFKNYVPTDKGWEFTDDIDEFDFDIG